ncbi:hypothetical protein DMH04_01585 [Kibdelosporangium aridum]|uniref:FecCD transport family protein n=1 Tax=Kibdelosporangium aridum TaxID=2030 RepID=A0A428ZUR3_KIBAR|nr:iron chelate uptake ABC transporter family permease subunit [Kibdelosporangium aridum]RSM91693.1 hypothetical protein DMH04_01585 [Kibdelosporangium aridum]
MALRYPLRSPENHASPARWHWARRARCGGAGACLAIAGAAVQSVVRNPLAEPGLKGITGGASVAAMLVILVLPAAPLGVLPVAATVGGVLALAIVMLIARQLAPTRVVLIGLGVAATTTALVNVMVLAPTEIPVGVVTALLGTPYLVWLLRAK